MITPECMGAPDVLRRYQNVRSRLLTAGTPDPAGGVSTFQSIPFDVASGYDNAEIFMGSRLHGDPKKTDFVRVMNFRPEPGKGEHILDEAFVQRTERTLGDRLHGRPGRPMLYHFVQEMTTGSHLIDAVMGVYDLNNGQRVTEKHAGAAFKAAERLQAEEGLYTPGGAGILT